MPEMDRPPKQRDVRTGLACAEAFQRLAELFIWRIGVVVKEGTQESSEEVGDLVACAANLAFALELYIKSLQVQLQVGVPKKHDLRSLYDALPDEVRAEIQEAYDTEWRSKWLGKRASITIAKGPRDEPEWKDKVNESKDMAALLDRSKNVFVDWRYVYEFVDPGDGAYQLHHFEYGLLLSACNSVRAAIAARLDR